MRGECINGYMVLKKLMWSGSSAFDGVRIIFCTHFNFCRILEGSDFFPYKFQSQERLLFLSTLIQHIIQKNKHKTSQKPTY